MSAHSGALEAVDRILNRGGDDDAVLRDVVAALQDRVFAWAAIRVGDADGPEAGERPQADPPLAAPIVRDGIPVGELRVAPRTQADDADRALVARVALLVSPHVRA